MKPLAFRQVALTHFKNYTGAEFHFGNRFNLISGLNGVGKTNLLDAVYYLCVGRSYFTPYDQRIVEHGQSFFRLEGQVEKGEKQHSVCFKVKPGTSKDLLVDQLPVERISHHLGFIPVVFSAPRDTELITGSGQYRRRYFDHLLCQVDPYYVRSLVDYNHLLQMRNAALKNHFEDLRRVVQTYDEQMAGHAAYIFEKRKWLSSVFSEALQQHYSSLSEGREAIGMEYDSMLHAYPHEVLADQNWEADKLTGRTQGGIHKDDFVFTIKGMAAREYGSQGQIKSLIFSLHLTKYALLREQLGFHPVLMLDDVFDKLDERRHARLMEILCGDAFGQVFISDTSHDRLSGILPGSQVTPIDLF